MGEAMSMGGAVPQIEKSARNVKVEEYVGCGHSFGRGKPTEKYRSSRLSSGSNHKSVSGLSTRERPVLSYENPEISHRMPPELPYHGVRTDGHQLIASNPMPWTAMAEPTQSMLQSRSGFIPYEMAVSNREDLQYQQRSATVITQAQLPTSMHLSRSSNNPMLGSRHQYHQQHVPQQQFVEVANIPQLQIPSNTRASLASMRLSTHSQNYIENERTAALEQKFKEIEFYFEDHNLDFAYKVKKQFLAHFEKEFLKHPDYEQRQAFFEAIDREYNDIILYTSQFVSPDWELKSDEKGTKVYLRKEGGSTAVLIEAELDVPVEVFAAVLNEVDLHKKIVPFVEYSKEEKRIRRNVLIGHVISNFPFISLREAYFQGAAYQRLETNDTVLIITRSIHDRPDLQKLYDFYPKPRKDSVLLNYKYLCMQYQPLTPKKGFVKLCTNTDMRLDIVPGFIMDYATRKFGVDMFTAMVKVSKKFKGSEWEKAMMKRPGAFQYFQRKLREYFGKRGVAVE